MIDRYFYLYTTNKNLDDCLLMIKEKFNTDIKDKTLKKMNIDEFKLWLSTAKKPPKLNLIMNFIEKNKQITNTQPRYNDKQLYAKNEYKDNIKRIIFNYNGMTNTAYYQLAYNDVSQSMFDSFDVVDGIEFFKKLSTPRITRKPKKIFSLGNPVKVTQDLIEVKKNELAERYQNDIKSFNLDRTHEKYTEEDINRIIKSHVDELEELEDVLDFNSVSSDCFLATMGELIPYIGTTKKDSIGNGRIYVSGNVDENEEVIGGWYLDKEELRAFANKIIEFLDNK